MLGGEIVLYFKVWTIQSRLLWSLNDSWQAVRPRLVGCSQLFHSKQWSMTGLTGPADPPVATALPQTEAVMKASQVTVSLSLSLSQSQTTRLAGRVWPEVWEAVIVHCYCSELVSSLRTGISSGVFMFIANLPLKPCFVPIVILCIHQYLCHCFCELSSGSFPKEINNEQERNK